MHQGAHQCLRPRKPITERSQLHPTCVHRAFGCSSTNNSVYLVNEQDDPAIGVCDLLDDSLSLHDCSASAEAPDKLVL
jgi:hypothetical protein